MRFRSDSQRKAVFSKLAWKSVCIQNGCNQFSKLNKFALKYDPYSGRVTSDEYPNVSFILFVPNPNEYLRELEDIPEQQLAGLGAIVSDDRMRGAKPFGHRLASYTSGVPVYGKDDVGKEVSVIRTRFPEEIEAYYEAHPEKGKYDFGDVLAHEVGHSVTANILGKSSLNKHKGTSEVVADKFMHEYTGAKQRHLPTKEEDLERAYSYLETLQELKTPSVGQLEKYAGDVE
jgi:hypothetical protein